MTANEFRELALSFQGAVEGQHMRHPDFRAHGKVFATLGYPDTAHGMVKLTPPDQAHFVAKFPQAFTPVKGAWGLAGCTSVLLASAQPDATAQALELAWTLSAAPAPAKARTAARQKTA